MAICELRQQNTTSEYATMATARGSSTSAMISTRYAEIFGEGERHRWLLVCGVEGLVCGGWMGGEPGSAVRHARQGKRGGNRRGAARACQD